MKKFLSIITTAAAAFMMFSCASISFNNTVYVEGAENFTAQDLTVTKLGSNYACGDYSVSFTSVKTDKSGFSIGGVGKTTETSTMDGIFKKGGNKLFNMNVTSVAEMWGASNGSSKNVWGSGTVTVTTGKNSSTVPMQKDDEGYIIRDESICPIAIQVVKEYKTEQGKMYKLPSTQFAGAKLYIGDELYAVVDLIANSSKIYTNPAFSRSLSDEETEVVMSYLMLVHKVCRNFQ